ncbi:DUF927 domain-containing protein [Laribacter hongkongensis]|uniref:DUF927 domain-containing protein n=1 Tax=Laribacter hongkongensis TaxID=168471 RepID=UPI001EFD34FA|nr:DUF927 domain-containing protein [Laribacter hongkongensis]MCG9116967.1 DUF927 domain-containing protein [Laribacter hongkongensis]
MGTSDLQSLRDAATLPALPALPRWELRDDGLWYIDGRIDPDTGKVHERAPLWLCGRLELVGCGADDAGHQYRIARWERQGNRNTVTIALPNAEVGEREGWYKLRDGGLEIATNRTAQSHLATWLQRGGNMDWHEIAYKTGWQHGAFVMPDGEMVGTPDVPVFFNGKSDRKDAYRPSGTLDDWIATVGRLSLGNALPMTAIACALAGPLLSVVGMRDGIGLHLYTLTSSGKSTCGDVAASVWGDPARTMRSWSSTGLAVSNEAEQVNDTLLYMDEIGSGNARNIGPAIYSALNGVAKMQGSRDGGNRPFRTWKVTMISTGEVRMSQFLAEGGQVVKGGQEIRLLDIPADAGRYRAFDCLHEFADGTRLDESGRPVDPGEAFSLALTEAARHHYGHVGRAWVQWIAANRPAIPDEVKAIQARLLADLPDGAAPAVRRATRKFGLLAAAAVLASRAGLTGWSEQEAFEGVHGGWALWLDAFGIEDRDDTRLIEQADGVLLANQFGRFIQLPVDETRGESASHSIMGRWRIEEDGRVLFLVQPHAFKNEVIAGFEPRHACTVLHRAGRLKRFGNEWTRWAGKNVGRVYHMYATPAGDENGEKLPV